MRAWYLAAAAMTVAGAVWALPAAAQQDAVTPARQYVEAAAQSDAFEMLEAETALTGSEKPAVRAYAEAMLRDHAATAEALRRAAAMARVDVPAMQPSADQAALLAALQGTGGEDFDRVYAEHQALAHRSALTVQRAYAENGDAPALRRVAGDALVVIERHLADAERLRATLGG